MSESRDGGEFRHVCNDSRTDRSLYTAQITATDSNNDCRRKHRRVLWMWMKPSYSDVSTPTAELVVLLMGAVVFFQLWKKYSDPLLQ